MLLEQIPRLALHRLITMHHRTPHPHRLAVHFEPVHFLHRLERRLFAVKHNKRLALALQATLGNDVENRPVVLEYPREGLLQRLNLDAFFEIIDLR